MFPGIHSRPDRRSLIVGAAVGDDNSDVGHVAAVASAGGENVVAHGVDGGGDVRGAAREVEVESVQDGVLHRVPVQVELDVWGVGIGHGSDPTVDVQVQSVDDLVHEVHLLQEIGQSHATGSVQCEGHIRLDATSCKNT